MTGIEVSFATWAATTLLNVFKGDSERELLCRERVGRYFDAVAETLAEISKKLRERIIPRVEGHKLKVMIDCFEVTLASNFLGKQTLKDKEGQRLLSQLRQAALKAEDADLRLSPLGDVIARGKPLDTSLVEDIERTAGLFYGLAVSMRSVGPSK